MKSEKARMRLFYGHLKLDEASLKKVFLLQLGNILSIKKYLADNLPGIAGQASFKDLEYAILESVDDIKLQILRMEQLFVIMKEAYEPQKCLGIRMLMTEGYAHVKSPGLTGLESDMMLLYHLNAVESLEISCFKFLHDIATSLPNGDLARLLKENVDSAKDNKALYEMIAREYLN